MHDGLTEVKLLRAVLDALEKMRVRTALIGAGAMATYGASRATRDIDLLTVDSSVLKEENWRQLQSAGVSVDVRRGDHDDPLAGVVRIVFQSDLPVDVIVGRFQWQQEIVERARTVALGPDLGPIELSVARASDLILLKLYAGGPQDLWDIRQLLDLEPALETEVAALVGGLPEESQRSWERLVAESGLKE